MWLTGDAFRTVAASTPLVSSPLLAHRLTDTMATYEMAGWVGVPRHFWRKAVRDILMRYPIHSRGDDMTTTTVFINNRSQAVRLPAEMRLPEGVKRVEVRARGLERIIVPVGHQWDSFFIDGPQVADDFMESRASQEQPDRESL
jgi:antitoxin VapB